MESDFWMFLIECGASLCNEETVKTSQLQTMKCAGWKTQIIGTSVMHTRTTIQ
jgi:hypothetical protein